MSGTVRVRMMQGRVDSRYDRRAWPAAGEEFDVPEWEADTITLADPHQSVPIAALVRPADGGGPEVRDGQWTVPAADSGAEEREAPSEVPAASKPAAAEPPPARIEPARQPAGADAGPDEKEDEDAAEHAEHGHASPITATGTAKAAGEPPSSSAPKQDWVAYAVSRDADPHEAGNMTKADLMSRYGTRPGPE